VRGLLRPGIVHRLDRLTSGLIAIAKNHLAHRNLSIQFQQHEVRKEYLAIVSGVLTAEQGCIDLPIGRRAAGDSILMSAKPDAREAKPACTYYEVLERLPAHTVVRLMPTTGRNHQLRVHLAELGHPILGDTYYRQDDEIAPHSARTDQRHLLHAEKIMFRHPITDEPLEYVVHWPNDFEEMYQICKAG